MPYPQKHVSAVLSDLTNQSATYSTSSVDLTLYHSGSFQVTTTSGAVTWTAVVEGSNDNTNFAQTAAPTPFTASGTLVLSLSDLTSRYYRVTMTRTGGTLTTATITYCAKAQR